MKFICALSNEIANEPVVSAVSGNVFEKRLILRYLEENGNCDPINGIKLTVDQLININLDVLKDNQNFMKKKNELSVPELIKFLLEKWDAMILQIFNLKKQLLVSEKEIEALLNQQNDSSKIINILNNELIKYRKMEDERNHANDLSSNLRFKNDYSNLTIIDQVSNKENQIASSINSLNCSSLKSDYIDQLTNHNNFKNNSLSYPSSINSKFSNSTNDPSSNDGQLKCSKIDSKFDDFFQSPKLNELVKFNQSPFQKYNKLSYSTEYVNLNNNKLFDRNYRTQSVIIQNDLPFDYELSSIKSLEENLNFRNNYSNCHSNSQINLDERQNEHLKSYNQSMFRPLSEQIATTSIGSSKGNNKSNNLKNQIQNEELLYSNLADLRELEDSLNLSSRKKSLALPNYENILMFNEDVNSIPISQKSINGDQSEQLITQTKLKEKELKNTRVNRIEGWSKNFDNLLNDSFGINFFTNFLIKEHSVENIKFWESCERFKKLTNKEDLKKKALNIYKKFIDKNAEMPINIDGRVKKIIIENYKKPTNKLFEDAQEEIYVLMRDDTYKRFLKSDMYKNSLEKCGNNNLLPIELIQKPDLPMAIKQKTRRKSLLTGWNKKNQK